MKRTLQMTAVAGSIALFSVTTLLLSATIEKNALQSPINLIDDVKVHFHFPHPFRGTVRVICEKLPEQGLAKEYMVEIAPTDKTSIDNYILVDGNTYFLRQFHFHMPSEHTINTVRKEAEIHFVHTDETDTKVAVVGAFITCGTTLHDAYQIIMRELPPLLKKLPACQGEGKKVALKGLVDIHKLLPLNASTYAFRYRGSKTSGDLAPGVEWIILTTPVELSCNQLQILEPIKSTGTKIHPRNKRSIRIEHVIAS